MRLFQEDGENSVLTPPCNDSHSVSALLTDSRLLYDTEARVWELEERHREARVSEGRHMKRTGSDSDGTSALVSASASGSCQEQQWTLHKDL